MAVFNSFKAACLNNTITLGTANIWCALVMTNTTIDTENDGVTYVGSFTTLDETAGSGYVRKKMASINIAVDDPNDRATVKWNDAAWTALGNGARQIQGALIYVDADDDGVAGGDDASNRVIAYIPFSSSSNPGGGDFSVKYTDVTLAFT